MADHLIKVPQEVRVENGGESTAPTEALNRVAAVQDLLRLERRIARMDNALRILHAHRESLVALISEE